MKNLENLVKPDLDQDLHRFVEIENELKRLKDTEQELEEPKRPFKVETWEEYVKYVTLKNAYEDALETIKQTRISLIEERKTIETKVKGLLPSEIWFRSNDGLLAYGIYFDTWNGIHTGLIVKAWNSTLPALDRRNYGG